MQKKLIYGNDYRGYDLKKVLWEGHDFNTIQAEDIGIEEGSPLDYVDISKKMADTLKEKPDAKGVLICGSGQGVAIALNRFNHVRAAMCRTIDDVINVRKKLDANVMCLGADNVPDVSYAQQMIQAFIDTPFYGEKHNDCVRKLFTQQTAHVDGGVNLIVRAIIHHKDHVLCTTTTPDNLNFPQGLFFLPGGHVNYNEPVDVALAREIWEEMNLTIDSMAFVGALECSWNRKGSIYHELDIVYKVDISNLDLDHPPAPMDHKFHVFVWKHKEDLPNLKILPEKLKPIIINSFKDDTSPVFLSQMIENI